MSVTKKVVFVLMTISRDSSRKNGTQINDDELIKKILETNDAFLFGKLYDRYSNKIFNKCYSFVKNKAEAKDLTQDIFLKLFIKLNKYGAQSKFSTWLYSFTYNFLVNYKKQDLKRKLGERWELLNNNEDHFADEHDIEEDKLFELKAFKLDKALELIDPADKAILLLKYQDEISINDIQVLLDIGESAVKMRLKRARIKVVKAHNKI
jgi:RNA polymerase sigma-70 factor (ECF subfamily)